jgi:hypothetical protein
VSLANTLSRGLLCSNSALSRVGGVAKWLGIALQKRVRRFNSGRHLQIKKDPSGLFLFVRSVFEIELVSPVHKMRRMRILRVSPEHKRVGRDQEG